MQCLHWALQYLQICMYRICVHVANGEGRVTYFVTCNYPGIAHSINNLHVRVVQMPTIFKRFARCDRTFYRDIPTMHEMIT